MGRVPELKKRGQMMGDVESKVLPKFRLGLKLECGKDVWKKIQEGVSGKGVSGVTNVAEFLGMGSHASVTKIKQGDLSSEMLFTILTILEWDYRRLDPLPDIEDRALGGYQVAIHYLRTGKNRPTCDRERIARQVFVTMCLLIRDPAFKDIRNTRKRLTERDWKTVAESVEKNVVALTGGVPYGSARELGELFATWGVYVSDCLFQIPFKWMADRIIGERS